MDKILMVTWYSCRLILIYLATLFKTTITKQPRVL